jgi:ech hydrogenase subunit E
MGKRMVIPFGPQHPVLPEPIHLDLVMEDEKVVQAIPSLGFIHRGLERLAEKKDFNDMAFVAERICGICSAIHGQGYVTSVEVLMGVEAPERAEWLRTFWGELSRIHSHTLWLGLFADGFGFESLFMHVWRLRERILDVIEETTGGRVIFGVCKVGGVRRDVLDDDLKRIGVELAEVEKELRGVCQVFEKDASVKRRLVGIGPLSREQAATLGAVGPTARASGLAMDARKLGYAVYGKVQWDVITENSCDCYARCMVRVREVWESFRIIRQVIEKIPAGPVDVKVATLPPKGEYFGRFEQPRGEVIYYVKGNGTKNLERFRVRTPTFANIPALVTMLQGCDLSAVPVITLCIDPCISCCER